MQRTTSKEKLHSGSLKLVVLGKTGCGKTLLINRFIMGSYSDISTPTVCFF